MTPANRLQCPWCGEPTVVFEIMNNEKVRLTPCQEACVADYRLEHIRENTRQAALALIEQAPEVQRVIDDHTARGKGRARLTWRDWLVTAGLQPPLWLTLLLIYRFSTGT